MEDALRLEQDLRAAAAIEREGRRLRDFIRLRVPDAGDAEDILQEVFYELVVAYRLMKPIEQAGAWLFRVARNRITDWFRKRRPDVFLDAPAEPGDESLPLADLLPSADAGPEAAFARTVLLEEIEAALGELPPEQRAVFVANEIEGRSFREMAEESGVSVNTLLSRKRYAVRFLRMRLRSIYGELTKG